MTYDELLHARAAARGATRDDLGAVGRLTPDRVRDAARLVRRGASFNLDHPLNAFAPPISPTRHAAVHTIFGNGANHRDDRLDSFYLQGSSHVDGLRHMKSAEHGWYDGSPDDAVAVGSPTLGVGRWAEHGIVGRGVLVDVERHLASRGHPIDQRRGQAIPVADIEETLRAQGTEVREGDLLLLRTGWSRHYFDVLTSDERRALPHHLVSPGLEQSHATLEWLRDRGVVMVASDNAAVECVPPVPDSPFATPAKAGAGGPAFVALLMHDILISVMGLVLGELWDLEALAEDCARDRVYEALLVCKPLNLTGGVGSPANAIALK